MVFRSFTASSRKINTIWQQAEISNKLIKDNNEFKIIDIEESVSTINKLMIKIPVKENATGNWFGSVELQNFTKQMLEYVYPIAIFNLTNRALSTKDIGIFDGSLYYWFNRINDNTYFFRYAVDSSLDTNESFVLNFSLIFVNKRIYDNLQKSKE